MILLKVAGTLLVSMIFPSNLDVVTPGTYLEIWLAIPIFPSVLFGTSMTSSPLLIDVAELTVLPGSSMALENLFLIVTSLIFLLRVILSLGQGEEVQTTLCKRDLTVLWLVSLGWLDLFSEPKLHNLLAPISDHNPLFLVTDSVHSHPYRRSF